MQNCEDDQKLSNNENSSVYRNITALKSALETFGVGQNWYANFWLRKTKILGLIGWGREPVSIVCLNGAVFAKALFPFLMDYDRSKPKVAEVCPNNVLGGQYYQIPKQDDEIWLMDELNRQTYNNDREGARYIKVGPFPYYVPVEGKNRVTLFSKYNKKIACLLREYRYPDARDLKLIRYGQFYTLKYVGKAKLSDVITPQYQFICEAESILAFSQSYEVLREYGVEEYEVKLKPWMFYKFEKARMITQCVVSETCYVR